jgi:hypothetical protein
MSTIGFQTSCYSKSYKLLLKDGLLINFLDRFKEIDFFEKTIIINNVNWSDKDEIEKLLVFYPSFKYYYAYKELYNNVLQSFNLNVSDFPDYGLHYSIQHFVGLYYTKCDYLLHVSEDCNIDNLDSQYIKDCIEILESNSDYLYAQPRWGTDPNKGTIEESIRRDGKFHIAKGCTDQIYLIRTKDYKQDIYHYEHPDSNRYPPKGGNSFERRVNSYMQCNNKYRVIHNDYHYIHGYYDNIIKGA